MPVEIHFSGRGGGLTMVADGDWRILLSFGWDPGHNVGPAGTRIRTTSEVYSIIPLRI